MGTYRRCSVGDDDAMEHVAQSDNLLKTHAFPDDGPDVPGSDSDSGQRSLAGGVFYRPLPPITKECRAQSPICLRVGRRGEWWLARRCPETDALPP